MLYAFLGNSPASEFYMPAFRNNLSHLHRQVAYPPMNVEQSVPKRLHIKFRSRGITQNKAYNKEDFAFACVSSSTIASTLKKVMPILTKFLLDVFQYLTPHACRK
jgi:hypothetical protein